MEIFGPEMEEKLYTGCVWNCSLHQMFQEKPVCKNTFDLLKCIHLPGPALNA